MTNRNHVSPMVTSLTPQEASSCTTVLLIDDNPEDLVFWSTALRNSSFKYLVFEASSAEAAFDLYSYQKVDCVVVDLDMPQSSGFDVLFGLIPDRKHPPIAAVILTCMQYPVLHEIAVHHGAQACLVKRDTTAEALHHAIQKAVTSVKSIQNTSERLRESSL